MRTTIEPPGHQFAELVRVPVPDTTDITILLFAVLALLFTKGRR